MSTTKILFLHKKYPQVSTVKDISYLFLDRMSDLLEN